MNAEVQPAGDAALLAWVPDQAAAHRLAQTVGCRDDVVDTVVGERSVLVIVDPLADDLTGVVRKAARQAARAEQPPARTVEIPVVYDGEDLQDVSGRTGIPVPEVVRRHAAGSYRVDFVGFSPGFGYLSGLDPGLQLPRRDTPRARVPAGAVAIAGARTCVYPQATPGGWWLLGRTDVTLFDPDRDPPALLASGDIVRFVERS